MGLTKKILLFTALLTVSIVVVTLVFSTVQANALAQANLSERLTSSRDIWDAFQADRLAKLKLGVRTLGNEPAFKALIEGRDAATIVDSLEERREDFGANFFMATDPAGLLLARSDKPTERGTDLSKDPVVQMSVQGEEAAGLWQEGDRMFHAVSTPLSTGENQQGVLIAGYALDGAVAKSLSRLTGADVAFLTGADQSVASSSLGPLEPALSAALKSSGPSKAGEAFDLVAAGEKYRVVTYSLENAAHRPVGSLVVLASYEKEMRPFIRFRNALFIVGGLMTILGLLGAQLIARRITDPILLLVDRVHKARDGSFAGAIPVHSTDEVGSLAKAFNGLLNELREKEQFIEFMRSAQPSGGTTNMPAVDPGATLGLGGTTAPAGTLLPGGDANLTIGTMFANRYRVVETLGRGGMGVVFRAKDIQLDEVVALKTLRSDVLAQDTTLLQRFKLEIKLARKITHKNVLRTHDFGEWEGTPYISMEYLEGVTLKDLQKRKGALPLTVGLQIAKQMCHGLAAAHAEGVVHRDIKPQNMLIIPETGDLKIMDFGIATVSNVKDEKKPDSAITGAGVVLGTPDYLPPELGRGLAADFRSDIYCMGVVLFELFCGKLPFTGASPLEIVVAHMQTPPPSPRSIKPSIPDDLQAIILRCLEKDPQKRFQTVDALTEALNAVSERQAA